MYSHGYHVMFQRPPGPVLKKGTFTAEWRQGMIAPKSALSGYADYGSMERETIVPCKAVARLRAGVILSDPPKQTALL
jgi:hypothetical protein